MKEAMYYKNVVDHIECRLCAHHCRIKEEKTGICRVRKNIGGKLYSLNYGKLTAIHDDPVEKKPLYHFMPATRTLSLGSYGCNFSCRFCQNYEIAQEEPSFLIDRTPEDIVDMAIREGFPSIAYTYNEPTVFYEFMLDTAKLAHSKGLKNIMVTNGFIEKEPLEELLEYMDAFNIDLKTFNDETYRKICGGRLQPVLETIKLANGKSHVEVTTLIVTGMNDTEEELTQIFEWLSGIDKDIPLHLSRYFPAYKYHEPPTDIDFLKRMNEKAKKYLNHVHLGNIF